MFKKKVSLEEYNEVCEKYLVFEASYKNAELKNEELEKEVLSLKKQLLELQENGVIAPDFIKNHNELAEKYKMLLNSVSQNSNFVETFQNEAEKLKIQAEEYREACTKACQQKNELLEQLDEERAKNRILESKINTTGGNKMAELTQWEYKYVKQDMSNQKELNEAGVKGWEAAGTFSNSGGSNYILLKRPKQKSQPNQSNPYDYGYSR